MLKIVIEVKRPPGQAIGIKEQIAMDLEKYGEVRILSVEEIHTMEQMMIDSFKRK